MNVQKITLSLLLISVGAIAKEAPKNNRSEGTSRTRFLKMWKESESCGKNSERVADFLAPYFKEVDSHGPLSVEEAKSLFRATRDSKGEVSFPISDEEDCAIYSCAIAAALDPKSPKVNIVLKTIAVGIQLHRKQKMMEALEKQLDEEQEANSQCEAKA